MFVYRPAAGGGNLSLKLQVPHTENAESASLHLYLQPTCQYQVTVNIDFSKVLSQVCFSENFMFVCLALLGNPGIASAV